jgi:hypothetical protein
MEAPNNVDASRNQDLQQKVAALVGLRRRKIAAIGSVEGGNHG